MYATHVVNIYSVETYVRSPMHSRNCECCCYWREFANEMLAHVIG
jgi:hypothetical protein